MCASAKKSMPSLKGMVSPGPGSAAAAAEEEEECLGFLLVFLDDLDFGVPGMVVVVAVVVLWARKA